MIVRVLERLREAFPFVGPQRPFVGVYEPVAAFLLPIARDRRTVSTTVNVGELLNLVGFSAGVAMVLRAGQPSAVSRAARTIPEALTRAAWRAMTPGAGASVKTTTGIVRAIAQRTCLTAVSFRVLTLATQGDDRVHSGRAPRRDVARQEYNHHEDHRHR